MTRKLTVFGPGVARNSECKLRCGAGEATVESDLDAAAAGLQRDVDLAQLLRPQAQGLLHENMPVSSQCGIHQGSVQIVPCGNQYGGVRLIGKHRWWSVIA